MYEAKDSGVEALAACLKPALSAGGINLVAQKRMTDMCHMYPYLMCPAGLQPAFHIGKAVLFEAPEHPVVCHRSFAALAYHCHFFPVSAAPSYIGINIALVFSYQPKADGVIDPVYAVLLKLPCNASVGIVIFADHH